LIPGVKAKRKALGVGPEEEAVLLLDGHTSHFGEVLNLLKKNHIRAVFFPSHTTHIVQPLDQLVFKTLKTWLKKFWKLVKGCTANQRRHRVLEATQNALYHALSPYTIKTSFCATGIFPWNVLVLVHHPSLTQTPLLDVPVRRTRKVPITNDVVVEVPKTKEKEGKGGDDGNVQRRKRKREGEEKEKGKGKGRKIRKEKEELKENEVREEVSSCTPAIVCTDAYFRRDGPQSFGDLSELEVHSDSDDEACTVISDGDEPSFEVVDEEAEYENGIYVALQTPIPISSPSYVPPLLDGVVGLPKYKFAITCPEDQEVQTVWQYLHRFSDEDMIIVLPSACRLYPGLTKKMLIPLLHYGKHEGWLTDEVFQLISNYFYYL
jgi:hypothetical protein